MSAQSIASVWEKRVRECASGSSSPSPIADIVDIEVTPWTPHSDEALNPGALQPSRFAAFGQGAGYPGSAGSSRTSTSSSTDRLMRRCSADKPPIPPPRLPAATVLEVIEEPVSGSLVSATSPSSVLARDKQRPCEGYGEPVRGSRVAAPSSEHPSNMSEDDAQGEILRLEQSLRQMDDDIRVLEQTVQRQAKAVGIL